MISADFQPSVKLYTHDNLDGLLYIQWLTWLSANIKMQKLLKADIYESFTTGKIKHIQYTNTVLYTYNIAKFV